MPKKPKDLAEEIVQEIIRIFAKREDPEHFKVIFSRVAGQKTITYSRDRRRYNNFLDTCQRRFFRRLSTNEDGWRIWPTKARRYLGIPEAPPPQPQPVVLRKQEGLPF
jgi:hypothetical protein